MKNIRQSYKIKASVEKVWQALVNPEIIEKWGGGPAKMSAKEGADFKLWGGDIFGKNLKVIENKELIQEWLQKGWKSPSVVTFKLKEKDGYTQVDLIHENVPAKDLLDISSGWKEYYLGPLKSYSEE